MNLVKFITKECVFHIEKKLNFIKINGFEESIINQNFDSIEYTTFVCMKLSFIMTKLQETPVKVLVND